MYFMPMYMNDLFHACVMHKYRNIRTYHMNSIRTVGYEFDFCNIKKTIGSSLWDDEKHINVIELYVLPTGNIDVIKKYLFEFTHHIVHPMLYDVHIIDDIIYQFCIK